MSNIPELWEVRDLTNRLTLESRGGADPALALTQDDSQARVELAHVKALVAALTDAAADLAEVLASGGVYHA